MGNKKRIGVWWGNLKERDRSENLGVDGRIILKDLKEIGWEGVDCICPARDRDKWWAVVNAVMNLRVP